MSLRHRLSFLAWAGGYWARTHLLRRNIPFIGGLVLNSTCNLSCRQCRVHAKLDADLTAAQAREALDLFYAKGIRTLAITGGEPLLWHSDDLDCATLIRVARDRGFRAISIYTNGTLPFDHLDVDAVFISLDGREAVHDALRGPGCFRRIMRTIDGSRHPNLIVNHTINAANSGEIESMCRLVAAHPKLNRIFFYFHTPYYGIDELFLPMEKKRPLIRELIHLKRSGLPIANSVSCLRRVAADDWPRPSDVCVVYAHGRIFRCCRAVGNPVACDNCGYLGYPEIQSILALRPDAIRDAFAYLSGSARRVD